MDYLATIDSPVGSVTVASDGEAINNQYEDHLGIELLYLSSLCARADADAADAPVPESVADFIEKHPLSWVDAFRARIAEAAPDGYFVSLAGLARALLAWHAEALRV